MRIVLAAICALCATANAMAHTDAEIANQVDFNPIINAQVPTQLNFISPQGPVNLGTLLKKKTTLLTFAWFDCPNLCGLILKSLADSSGALRRKSSQDFQVIVVSMDARASLAQARHKQQSLAQRYPQAQVLEQWRFLTGSAEAVDALAEAVGYRFVYDQRKQQFAHPVGIIALGQQGQVRDFITGVNYSAQNIDRLLRSTRAAAPIAAQANPLLLLCYDYDPSNGRYSLAIMKLLRLLAILCLLALGAAIWYWQKKRRAENHE